MPNIGDEVFRLGLDLSNEAMASLEKLPFSHATELLEATQQKFQSGHLKDPSNYICATVSRGYVPRTGGSKGANGASGKGAASGGSGGGGGRQENYEAAAAALINTPGMQKAEQAGVSLTDDAVQALLTIPASHASEILEAVAEKHADLRDPSNYVIATITRGYVSREGGGKSGGGKGSGSLYDTIYGSKGTGGKTGGPGRGYDEFRGKGGSTAFSGPIGASAAYGPYGGAWSGGPTHPARRNTNLLPNDLSRVESAVLELNDQDLWHGQEISCATLLSLRCINEDDAMDFLQNLQGKGMSKGSKGSKGIGNLNNYIQAAVAKIAKEGGPGAPSNGKGGKNYTGNQSKQKADELGLNLTESTFDILARMPLRKALRLIEDASQQDGEDANHFIEREARDEEPHSKRARVG